MRPAPGITEFGYRLSRQTASPSKNWVASPLSIAYAFAMARAGVSGETATEIDWVFGFSPSGTDEAFSAATSETVIDHGESPQPSDAPRPPVVLVGNALFAAKGQQIGEAFLHTLAAQHGTGVYQVDFHSAEAAQAINERVRGQTADLWGASAPLRAVLPPRR